VARTATNTTVRTTAARPPPPSPALSQLRASLQALQTKAGPGTGVLVYDLTARATLFSVRAVLKRPPASVEKLYTSAALVRELGPGAQLETAVDGAGHLGPGGVWHGDLYLRGGGDPTFGDGTFNQTWEQGYGPTATQLAQQVAAAGISRVTGKVIGDASLLDQRPGGPASGYAPDVPDYGGQLGALVYDHGSTSGSLSPGAFAAKEFTLALRGKHVRAKAAPFTGTAPTGALELAAVNSPPLSVLLKLMDVPSDDLFADLLTEQLGLRFGTTGTITAGAQVISRQVAEYGVHPDVVDGSGLSRADLSSPAEIVALLRSIWRTPVGDVLWDALPTVGVNGTAQRIAPHSAAQGRCLAKTGTLNDVTNLAGYCHSRGHQVLAFALLIDGPPNYLALGLLSGMVTAIAKY
jgi:D-alanyl-D-alanine carboxypeptidase/D-alanyl-D-alanine-endopeptidase (penicillin-binding protein 4)